MPQKKGGAGVFKPRLPRRRKRSGSLSLDWRRQQFADELDDTEGIPHDPKGKRSSHPKLGKVQHRGSNMCRGCGEKHAAFGPEGGQRTFCAACKGPAMIDLMNKKCEGCGDKYATFGPVGGRRTFCTACKGPGMVDLVSKMCEGCGEKHATFGPVGGRRRFCATCKGKGMVDLKHKMCNGCHVKHATFGPVGGKRTFCAACKRPGMVYRGRNKCKGCGKKTATFGHVGGRKTSCSSCRAPGMVKLSRKMCERCGQKAAYFGPVSGKKKFCKSCKDPSNVSSCALRKCKLCKSGEALYGLNAAYPTCCSKCKPAGVAVVEFKSCTVCSRSKAIYGAPGSCVTHCNRCKEKGMVNLWFKTCADCGALTALFTFPNEDVPSRCKKCVNKQIFQKKIKAQLQVPLTRGSMCSGLWETLNNFKQRQRSDQQESLSVTNKLEQQQDLFEQARKRMLQRKAAAKLKLKSGAQKHIKRSDGLIPCFEWDKVESCKFGDACKFSHLGNLDDGTKVKSTRKRKAVCFAFVDGKCIKGSTCKYRHVGLTKENSIVDYQIARCLAPKGSQEEKLARIKKLPMSMRQKARAVFFAKTAGQGET